MIVNQIESGLNGFFLNGDKLFDVLNGGLVVCWNGVVYFLFDRKLVSNILFVLVVYKMLMVIDVIFEFGF